MSYTNKYIWTIKTLNAKNLDSNNMQKYHHTPAKLALGRFKPPGMKLNTPSFSVY